MKNLLLLFLLTLISCGNPNSKTSQRCYTRDEAILKCQVEEMAKLGVDIPTARMICLPNYQFQGCYSL